MEQPPAGTQQAASGACGLRRALSLSPAPGCAGQGPAGQASAAGRMWPPRRASGAFSGEGGAAARPVPAVTLSPRAPRPGPRSGPTAPRPGGHPRWGQGRGGDPRRETPRPPPPGGPSQTAPGKGGAAHRSLGRRLQGAARRRRPPAQAAPRARSTRAAILLGASAPTTRAPPLTPPPRDPSPGRAPTRPLQCGARPPGGAGRLAAGVGWLSRRRGPATAGKREAQAPAVSASRSLPARGVRCPEARVPKGQGHSFSDQGKLHKERVTLCLGESRSWGGAAAVEFPPHHPANIF